GTTVLRPVPSIDSVTIVPPPNPKATAPFLPGKLAWLAGAAEASAATTATAIGTADANRRTQQSLERRRDGAVWRRLGVRDRLSSALERPQPDAGLTPADAHLSYFDQRFDSVDQRIARRLREEDGEVCLLRHRLQTRRGVDRVAHRRVFQARLGT